MTTIRHSPSFLRVVLLADAVASAITGAMLMAPAGRQPATTAVPATSA